MVKYGRQRYLLMTVDPVHIGTGGYRLGRVDNSIVREPGTQVPKIPGTSLHGAARSHAAHLYGTPRAAGQKVQGVGKPEENPVCYTFGYIDTDKNGQVKSAYSGVINMYDAHIVLFPVHSMVSPVWVTTEERLSEAGFVVKRKPEHWPLDSVAVTWEREQSFNLGWLMVTVAGRAEVDAPDEWKDEVRWRSIKDRIVVVHERLFGHIVNSNLEVRTSVSINPLTHAAEDKALFTYEAIPRAAFLVAEVVLNGYREGKDPFPVTKAIDGRTIPGGPWNGPLDVVNAGLRAIEWLGVGGMGTRGFGRIAIVGKPIASDLFVTDRIASTANTGGGAP